MTKRLTIADAESIKIANESSYENIWQRIRKSNTPSSRGLSFRSWQSLYPDYKFELEDADGEHKIAMVNGTCEGRDEILIFFDYANPLQMYDVTDEAFWVLENGGEITRKNLARAWKEKEKEWDEIEKERENND